MAEAACWSAAGSALLAPALPFPSPELQAAANSPTATTAAGNLKSAECGACQTGPERLPQVGDRQAGVHAQLLHRPDRRPGQPEPAGDHLPLQRVEGVEEALWREPDVQQVVVGLAVEIDDLPVGVRVWPAVLCGPERTPHHCCCRARSGVGQCVLSLCSRSQASTTAPSSWACSASPDTMARSTRLPTSGNDPRTSPSATRLVVSGPCSI